METSKKYPPGISGHWKFRSLFVLSCEPQTQIEHTETFSDLYRDPLLHVASHITSDQPLSEQS